MVFVFGIFIIVPISDQVSRAGVVSQTALTASQATAVNVSAAASGTVAASTVAASVDAAQAVSVAARSVGLTAALSVRSQAASLTAASSGATSNAVDKPLTISSVSAIGTGQRARDVILHVLPRLNVPTSSLFVIHAAPGSKVLVETDPRFTQMKAFISSDYFLQQLNKDPERQLKRYGDGYFEQQLVNDQILALTGRRFLSGYASTVIPPLHKSRTNTSKGNLNA